MKTSTKFFLGAGMAMGLSVTGIAQTSTVLDGGYIEEHTQTQRVVPYPHIRQADVMWSRRVWREIDLRQKINLPLYYPIEPIMDRASLFDVIKKGLLEDGSITAYDPGPVGQDDEFTKALLPSDVEKMLMKIDTLQTPDIETGEMMTVIDTIETKSENIKQYILKEDWIFDRQRSVMDIRIIGICPMEERIGDDGEVRGYKPLFWLYFPELRYVLVNWEVFNRENDAERRSYDNFFWTRMFNSRITKVSNVHNRSIVEYKLGMDALLEGETIKADLFNFEHDLWNF